MKKLLLFFGISGILLGIVMFFSLSEKIFLASTFFYEQKTSNAEIFIPQDLFGGENEIGEIPIVVGESFPLEARNDALGFSVDLSWDTTKLDFLGIDQMGTLFASGSGRVNLLNSQTARIILESPGGISIAPKDILSKASFRIRENVTLGEKIPLSLSGAQIAHNTAAPNSISLENIQKGNLMIGSLADPNAGANVSEDFFFEEGILARTGEERIIALKSTKSRTLTGFVFDVFLPENKTVFLEATTEGTPLSGKEFEILVDQKTPNHIRLLGATGNLGGATVVPDDPVIFLRVLMAENTSEGEIIPLSIGKMHTTDTDLNLQKNPVRSGSLRVSSVSTLALANIEPLSPTEILMEFNDDIVSANLSDITISPNLKNAGSSLEIDGKNLILKNLDPSAVGQIYRLDAENIVGNTGGLLSAEENFGFFRGFPPLTGGSTSDFFIEKIIAKSETNTEVWFSQEVNPASVEKADFVIPGVVINTASASGKIVYLTTNSTAGMIGSNFLTIANQNSVSDLVSTQGKLLSLNIFPFTPFGATSDGPQITSTKAEKGNIVEITFDKALLGSSLDLSDLSIVEDGDITLTNLITPATTLEISGNRKTITLQNVVTLSGKKYRLSITPGSIRENSNAQNLITTTGNIASFLGQESFYSPWNFTLESVEASAPNTILASFSSNIAESNISPLDLKILSLDEGGSTTALKILSVSISGKVATLTTEVQIPKKRYFVVLNPEKWSSSLLEKLGTPSGKGFLGFFEESVRILGVNPREINVGIATEVEISGKNFPNGTSVFVGNQEIPITNISSEKIKISLPEMTELGLFDLVVLSPDGSESRIANGISVIDPLLEEKLKPVVLSEESFASPFRIPNDGVTKSTLWVRVKDPRGVSDIDKVSLDLRSLNGNAGVEMRRESFVDNSAWYVLDITIPNTVSTKTEPTEIPVTLENKTGRKAYGTVQILISRDLEESVPPVVEKANAVPPQITPGDTTPVTFQVEVSDADGAVNIARVVVDASAIGLGVKVLRPLEDIQQDAECTRNDYVLGEWSACISGKQTRTIDLRAGVECSEVADKKPIREQTCAERSCTASDWEAKEWSACVNGKQTREYQKKSDSFCVGDNTKPTNETQDCSVSFLQEILFPKANAASLYGNSVWYESDAFLIPNWATEGKYDLPVTVIDREGTEGKGIIHFEIQRNGTGSPSIDEIYISPRASIPNDGATEFQIFAWATDPNGIDDIASVTANLAPLGIGPTTMTKNQTDGIGAWYSTGKLTIPRQTVKGFREIEISVTDKNSNRGTGETMFYVSFPGEDEDGPKISIDRAYSNPRAFLNDERTTGSLYVFVEEGDSTIAHVSANLGSIGKYIDPETILAKSKTENPTTAFWKKIWGNSLVVFAEETSQTTNTANTTTTTNENTTTNQNTNATDTTNQNTTTNTTTDTTKKTTDGLVPECVTKDPFVCLTPSVSEGATGRWYVLPNLTIRKTVEASQDPYFFSVVATDIYGKKAEAEIPIFVSDGILPMTNKDMPHLEAVIATDHNKVDVIFSSALKVDRITRDAFDIVFFQDEGSHLPIRDYDIRADGRAVTLETNSMLPGDKLALIVDTEKLGLRNTHANDGKMAFDPYSKNTAKKEFLMSSVSSVAANGVKIVLNKDILFETLAADGSNFTITEKTTNIPLVVRGAQISENGKNILISTGTQRSGVSYVLRVKNLLDFSGKSMRLGTRIKVFEGYKGNPEELTMLFNQADFNRDGKVDFLDFSIFSTVYGTVGTTLPDDSSSDLNGDGRIDFIDFTIFAQQYGQKSEETPPPDNSTETPKTPENLETKT